MCNCASQESQSKNRLLLFEEAPAGSIITLKLIYDLRIFNFPFLGRTSITTTTTTTKATSTSFVAGESWPRSLD